MAVTAIAAIARTTRALGKHNNLLWHLPGDLPRFKRITHGHPVIMGTKTLKSLPGVLPGRTNIVLSRTSQNIPGVHVVSSPQEALDIASTAPGAEQVFVIGGGEIYTALLPHTDELLLTLVDDEPDADVFFPEYEHAFTQIEKARHEHDGLSYAYTRWVRD